MKWVPEEIRIGLVVQGRNTSRAVIIGHGWSHGKQKFNLGGLNGNPLQPFSGFRKGATSKELADYFNAHRYIVVDELTTNFKNVTHIPDHKDKMYIKVSTDGVGRSLEERVAPEERHRRHRAILDMIRMLLDALEKP
jgi:hypothetical protein